MHPRWFGNHHRFLTDPSSDAALLGRYHDDRDPAAFECLVWRHSGLVLATCERMLRDQHLAEDAYQATFLILARKAGTVHGVLPAWLHKVARRVCLRLQKKRPMPLESDVPARAIRRTIETDETTAILDTEIARLPEKLRRVIVLCYLQNLTAEAAAQHLGIPRGTVLSRLDTARRKLQATLTRRDVAPLALLAIPLIHPAPAVALVQATTRAVLEFSSGAVTTPITELATEVLQMTTRKWIAGTALAIMLIAGTTTGIGLFTANGPGTSQVVAQAPTVPAKPAVPKPADDAQKVELLKQMQQLEKLEMTEGELRRRISNLYDVIAKEQSLRDAEVTARALMQAIDKIDQLLLDSEVTVHELQTKLDKYKSKLREDKQYPLEQLEYYIVPNEIELPNPKPNGHKDYDVLTWNNLQLPEIMATFPGYVTHMEALATFRKIADTANPKKIEEINMLRQQAIVEFDKNVKPDIQKKLIEVRRDACHRRLNYDIDMAKSQIKSCGWLNNKTLVRRAELIKRHRKASEVSETQKLLEDELQVLREFHKTVMKQKLTLKLELDGVKLPAESQK